MAKKILIVEDEVEISELVNIYLTELGYQTTVVSDGLDAYVVFMQEKYDLVITDILMENMQGTKLIELIRSNGYGVPIIVLSALTEKYDKKTALDYGANYFLEKPFSISELGKIVNNYI